MEPKTRPHREMTNITVVATNPSYASVDGVLFNKDLTTLIQVPGALSGSYTIPDSVTSIGDSAASGCDLLTSVTIPNSVTTIGEKAFAFCEALANVTVGNGVIEIGYSAFRSCGSLTSITIPESVTSIGAIAFRETSIQHDYEVNGLKYLFSESATAAFLVDATEASGTITIPSQVMGAPVLSVNAFSGNEKITNVTIPDSVTTVGNWAFNACNALTGVTIGDGVTTIGNGAFMGCTALVSVTIPDSVFTINWRAFFGCWSTTIKSPRLATTIIPQLGVR